VQLKKFIFNTFQVVIALYLIPLISFGQDPQFTQFYSAPLYLNPAFVGATPCFRVGLNYRNQWTLSDRPYSTAILSLDYQIRSIKAGIGGYVMYDNPGAGGFTTYEFAPIISKEVTLRDDLKFRLGVKPSYQQKYQVGNKYTYGDNFTNLQPTGGSIDNGQLASSYNFFDLAAGLLLYSNKFWVGLAADHIVHIGTPLITNYVPLKLSLHGGMKFELNDGYETVLKPAFQLKNQGAGIQADLGFYYERAQWVLGAWYRGIPVINSSSAAINQDALGLLVGLKISSLQIGYSYDLPLSKMIYTFGSHELSAIFEFCMATKRRAPPRYIQELPCPTF
jgi:type IX secretion system PorP/SprF family membrane protein